MKTKILRARIIQRELFHFLSLHKNAVVITLIITSHIYQNYTAILSHLEDAAKYTACTLRQLSVATMYKIKHFMLTGRPFASIKSANYKIPCKCNTYGSVIHNKI